MLEGIYFPPVAAPYIRFIGTHAMYSKINAATV